MGKYTASVYDHLILPARVTITQGRAHEMHPLGTQCLLRSDSAPYRYRIEAATTLIPGLIRHLRVSAASNARVITPFDTLPANLFWVCLDFPGAGLAPFPEVLVARLPMPAALSQFHGLLGRDLLRRSSRSATTKAGEGCYSLSRPPWSIHLAAALVMTHFFS